jgi:ABC-type uncharacterized transport system permease subunit
MKKVLKKSRSVLSFLAMLMIVGPAQCFAFTAPATGDTGYEIYDFVTSTLMDGAIGISVVIGLFIFAGYLIARSQGFAAVAVFIGAIVYYNAENIALAIGCVY